MKNVSKTSAVQKKVVVTRKKRCDLPVHNHISSSDLKNQSRVPQQLQRAIETRPLDVVVNPFGNASSRKVHNAWENKDQQPGKFKFPSIHKFSHFNQTEKTWRTKTSSQQIPIQRIGQESSSEPFGQTWETHNKQKREKKSFRCHLCRCSCSCARLFCLAVCLILLAAVLAAILMAALLKTSTTTTTTTASTATSTTSTTTSTTSITTTTTTALVCRSSCVNQTWISSANQSARWLFDGNLYDQYNTHNASISNNISFVTNGYVNQAIAFNPNATQMLNVPSIPLSNTSFTVDTWLYVPVLANIKDHGIFGYCLTASSYQCLHLTIHLVASGFVLYLGFYSADCQGTTPLPSNTWFHAAFVFDITTLTQQIYINGILDNTCTQSHSLMAPLNNITIGYIPAIASSSAFNYFQGYIDQMTVSLRPKSACEILELATLVAYFTFDNASLLVDSGPNSLQATTQSTSAIPTGHSSQALHFDGTSFSYFQIADLVALGTINQAFSISLWIRPSSLSGVVVHVSSSSSGTGWCMPFLGFAGNGSLIAQIYNNRSMIVSVCDSTASVNTATWSHVVQTWSVTNGLRLFINNILVASNLASANTYAASTTADYLTLGNGLNATGICASGQLGSLAAYSGDMDEVRIYSRELSFTDVCTLYTN